MKRISSKTLVLYALFTALTLLLGLTPIGYIYLPIAAITVMHIPTILAGVVLGVKGGMFIGFLFGVTSLISCFTSPDATAMIVLGTNTGFGLYNLFLVVVILFVPRILCGLFSALIYRALSRKKPGNAVALGLGALTGSLTNTVLFLGGLYLFAYEQSAAGFGLQSGFTSLDFVRVLLGVASLNGLLEAAAAVILTVAIGKVLLKIIPPKNETTGENACS